MKIIITGSAGFIGSELCIRLLKDHHEILGIDNLNDYYDVQLKKSRLKRFESNSNFKSMNLDLTESDKINDIVKKFKPKLIINLAAQAGVRYSFENPKAYINSNIIGFHNILDACKINNINYLIYASSSSVYGANTKIPFSLDQKTECPKSLYAATKKTNELMAYTYSHIYKIKTIGLRFFTVYGPWDRPDMALQQFAHAIHNGKKIQVFNNGNHKRDFTYIDDVIESIVRLINISIEKNFNEKKSSFKFNEQNPYKIYNVGSNRPVDLIRYIELLEKYLKKKSIRILLPLQPGDVKDTWADTTNLMEDIKYSPATNIETGVKNFCDWFLDYYY